MILFLSYIQDTKEEIGKQTGLGNGEYLIKLKVVVIPSYVILTVRGNLFCIFKGFMKSFTWKKREDGLKFNAIRLVRNLEILYTLNELNN